MNMEDKKYLTGGREDKIYKKGETVVRPANKWTSDIHRFLNYLIEEGADFVPVPYGVNESGEEILSFMPGDVYNYPLPEIFMTDSMVVSAARLLFKYHEYSARYIKMLTHKEQWMLPPVSPVEVLCHGDFAPYNVTVTAGQAANMIDFDTVHPGSRMWDIVYAVYRWVPLTAEYAEADAGLEAQIKRTKLFLDTYDVNERDRKDFVKLLLKRLNSLTDYMSAEAANGNEDFQANITDGHLQRYLDDISYIGRNEEKISNGIL